MTDEAYIDALNQAVKQEVISRYMFERRLLDEEVCMLNEDVCSLHGADVQLGRLLANLAKALISRRAGRQFFETAGLGRVPDRSGAEPLRLERPKGWTRLGRYRRLVMGLYGQVQQAMAELAKELQEVFKLLEEVNLDILEFEKNHDLLSLSSYLASLDLGETQRRKIMGANFTAAEKAVSAAALSFKPLADEALGIDDPDLPSAAPPTPEELLPLVEPILKRVCANHPQEVDALFA